jgi:hypothetical protein
VVVVDEGVGPVDDVATRPAAAVSAFASSAWAVDASCSAASTDASADAHGASSGVVVDVVDADVAGRDESVDGV